MKRIITTALCLTLLFASWAVAGTKDISEIDGNEWRTWDRSQRSDFISGFIAGVSYVIEENKPFPSGMYMGKDYDKIKAFELYHDYKSFKPMYEAREWINRYNAPPPSDLTKPLKPVYSRDEVSLLLEKEYRERGERLTRYEIIGITNGQIVDGLDLFYGDFRNRQIKLSDAIYVTKKQILGSSKEEIEAITEWLRDPNRDLRKKYYKDKEGNPRNGHLP